MDRIDDVAFVPDYSDFDRVIQMAKSEVAQKGGKILFVHLPDFRDLGLKGDQIERQRLAEKNQVLDIVRTQGIDVIDANPVLQASGNPQQYFPFGIEGHYTEEGYQLVADAIIEFLEHAADTTISPRPNA